MYSCTVVTVSTEQVLLWDRRSPNTNWNLHCGGRNKTSCDTDFHKIIFKNKVFHENVRKRQNSNQLHLIFSEGITVTWGDFYGGHLRPHTIFFLFHSASWQNFCFCHTVTVYFYFILYYYYYYFFYHFCIFWFWRVHFKFAQLFMDRRCDLWHWLCFHRTTALGDTMGNCRCSSRCRTVGPVSSK